jgi:hypothetical protein
MKPFCGRPVGREEGKLQHLVGCLGISSHENSDRRDTSTALS